MNITIPTSFTPPAPTHDDGNAAPARVERKKEALPRPTNDGPTASSPLHWI